MPIPISPPVSGIPLIVSDPAALAVVGLSGAALFGALAHTFSTGESFRDDPVIYSAPRKP